MNKNIQRGLDYTPLYMFLLSSIGKNWDDTFNGKTLINKYNAERKK